MIKTKNFNVFIIFVHFSSLFSSALESRVNCNRTYYGNYGSTGVVSSYNFPFDYRHNLKCFNRIFLPPSRSPQEGRKVCFTFKFFSMEKNSQYCSFDRLFIWDGVTENKYCATGLYHYGIEEPDNNLTNVWKSNFCWPIRTNTTLFNFTFTTDDSVNATGFMAFYQVFSNLSGLSQGKPTPSSHNNFFPTSLAQKNKFAPCDLDHFVCPVDRRCVPTSVLCDGNIDCNDAADESFAFARCPDSQDLIACDFSHDRNNKVCGMDLEGWAVARLPLDAASKSSWMPDVDHTVGKDGNYLHTYDLPALLKSSPTSLLPHFQYCLRFWYILRKKKSSPSLNNLTLSVYLNEDLLRPDWQMSLFTLRSKWHKRKKTKPPMDWDSAGWRLAEIVLEPSSKPVRVLFSVRNDQTFSSSLSFPTSFFSNSNLKKNWQEGGVALDDISILEGACFGIDLQCNFESTMCGWESYEGHLTYYQPDTGFQKITPNNKWKIYDYKYSEFKEVHYDKSSIDGNGNFVYVVLSPSTSKDTALFISPPIATTYKEVLCFTFWYMKSTRDSCELKVLLLSYDQRLWGPLWSDKQSSLFYPNDDASMNENSYIDEDSYMRDKETGDGASYDEDGTAKKWTYAQVKIVSNGPFRILLEVSRTDSYEHCMVGVDAIRIERSMCKHICSPNEFRCGDSSCIVMEARCNGMFDCEDESDEMNCNPPSEKEAKSSDGNVSCVPPSILCNNGTFCLPEKWLCDGMKDCVDGLDELDCGYTYAKNTEDNDIYGLDFGSEGAYENGESFEEECTQEDFHCLTNNECVSKEDFCNGKAECTDHSDETNCTGVTGYIPGGCPPYFNPCYSGSPCVSEAMMCDGKPDCPNGSDENTENCATRTAQEQKHRSMSIVIGVVCAILLSLLLIICVVVFLLLSRRRFKRCQSRGRCLPPPSKTSIAVIYNSPEEHDGSKSQQKALKKSLENNKLDDEKNKHVNYKDESESFLADESTQKRASQQNNAEMDLAFADKDLDENLVAKMVGDYGDFGLSSPSQLRRQGVFNSKHFTVNEPYRGSNANSVGDHIYEEPSRIMSLMKQPASKYGGWEEERTQGDHMDKFDNSKQNSELRFSPGSSRFLSSMTHQDPRNALSAVTNPSATCHRISRIRLGTTALQPRNETGAWSDNRGHATMGRPLRNQQTSFLDGRRKSGGFDVDRLNASPTSPEANSTDVYANRPNLNTGIGREEEMVMMMMARETSNGLIGSSKSSTPADSSNSSNSASSNTHLLPNNHTPNFNNNSINLNFLQQHNKFKKDAGILPGIGYSSDCMRPFNMQQIPYHKHNSLLQKNLFQQKQMNFLNNANGVVQAPSNDTSTLDKQHLQQLQLQLQKKQQNLQEIQKTLSNKPELFVQQIYSQQKQQIPNLSNGDDFLNPTCV